MPSDAEPYAFEVRLTQNAALSYQGIASKADLKSVNKLLGLLDTVPEIGHVYDPVYESALPPLPMRVAYAGNYGIYFSIDDEQRRVDVYYLEDQRGDPLERFSS